MMKKRGLPAGEAGFTLMELMVYIALFSLFFVGSVSAAFNIFESSGRNQTKAMIQEEGDFLIAKINWALSSDEAVNMPLTGSIGSILSVNKLMGVTVVPIEIKPDPLGANNITIARNANPPQTLNNSNVEISTLIFDHKSASGGGNVPESVKASFTLSAKTPGGMTMSQDFSSTNYLRK